MMQSSNDHPLEWHPLASGGSGALLGGPPLSAPIDDADHIRGANTALVTLVEYADFECLNCARAFPRLVRLLDEFQGTLRVVFRHFPLGWEHPGSALAARAAEAAARQGKFWEMHDELLQNPGMLHREALPAHAASIGLDLGRFASDLDDPTLVARVERDVASGRASSVNATPTFFLDGARYANSRNLDGLRDAIFEATIRSVQRRG